MISMGAPEALIALSAVTSNPAPQLGLGPISARLGPTGRGIPPLRSLLGPEAAGRCASRNPAATPPVWKGLSNASAAVHGVRRSRGPRVGRRSGATPRPGADPDHSTGDQREPDRLEDLH